jgi:hypothetical protein
MGQTDQPDQEHAREEAWIEKYRAALNADLARPLPFFSLRRIKVKIRDTSDSILRFLSSYGVRLEPSAPAIIPMPVSGETSDLSKKKRQTPKKRGPRVAQSARHRQTKAS